MIYQCFFNLHVPLRYYATLEVRIFESLFYKINTFLKKKYHFYSTVVRANILCKYIICKFLNFWRGFCGSFSMLFPKDPAFCDKKNLKIFFPALYFYLHELKKYQIFRFQIFRFQISVTLRFLKP